MANVASIWYILLEEHREYVRKEGIETPLEEQYVPASGDFPVEGDVVEGDVPFEQDVPDEDDKFLALLSDLLKRNMKDCDLEFEKLKKKTSTLKKEEPEEVVICIRAGPFRPLEIMPVIMEEEDDASYEEDETSSEEGEASYEEDETSSEGNVLAMEEDILEEEVERTKKKFALVLEEFIKKFPTLMNEEEEAEEEEEEEAEEEEEEEEAEKEEEEEAEKEEEEDEEEEEEDEEEEEEDEEEEAEKEEEEDEEEEEEGIMDPENTSLFSSFKRSIFLAGGAIWDAVDYFLEPLRC